MGTKELSNMSIEGLQDLKSKVIGMLKLKQQMQGLINLESLREGLPVAYNGRSSKLDGETFIIEKINKVNVVCVSDQTGQRWNIKPASLRLLN